MFASVLCAAILGIEPAPQVDGFLRCNVFYIQDGKMIRCRLPTKSRDGGVDVFDLINKQDLNFQPKEGDDGVARASSPTFTLAGDSVWIVACHDKTEWAHGGAVSEFRQLTELPLDPRKFYAGQTDGVSPIRVAFAKGFNFSIYEEKVYYSLAPGRGETLSIFLLTRFSMLNPSAKAVGGTYYLSCFNRDLKVPSDRKIGDAKTNWSPVFEVKAKFHEPFHIVPDGKSIKIVTRRGEVFEIDHEGKKENAQARFAAPKCDWNGLVLDHKRQVFLLVWLTNGSKEYRCRNLSTGSQFPIPVVGAALQESSPPLEFFATIARRKASELGAE